MSTGFRVRMMRSILLAMFALQLLSPCEAQRAMYEGEGNTEELPLDDEMRHDHDDAMEDELMANERTWLEFTGHLRRAVDADTLIRARRWGNIANGVLLEATGPVTFALSTAHLKLSNMVLSLYVSAFGALISGVELNASPVAPWVAENLSYLASYPGRTALLAFVGNLVWYEHFYEHDKMKMMCRRSLGLACAFTTHHLHINLMPTLSCPGHLAVQVLFLQY